MLLLLLLHCFCPIGALLDMVHITAGRAGGSGEGRV